MHFSVQVDIEYGDTPGNFKIAVSVEQHYSQNRCIARTYFNFVNRIGFFLVVNHRPGDGVTQITIETKIETHSKQHRHLGKSEM